MRRLLACALSALTLASAHAEGLAGGWTGTYTCLQGVTALDLSVQERKGGTLAAQFHFHADPTNPGVPEGCYNMRGTYDAASRRLSLAATSWVRRPRGYVTVDMEGTRDRAGSLLAGRILSEGCTGFVLHPATEPFHGCTPDPDQVAALTR